MREVMNVGECAKCGTRYIEPNDEYRARRKVCVCGGVIKWGTRPVATRGDAVPEMTKDVGA